MIPYMVRKRYKKKCIQGFINLPYGTEVWCSDNNLLFYNNKPICYVNSQDGLDYFVSNENGSGEERAKLIEWILNYTDKKFLQNELLYNKIWDMIWSKRDYLNLKRSDNDDRWIWNYKFFRAPISILKELRSDIEAIK